MSHTRSTAIPHLWPLGGEQRVHEGLRRVAVPCRRVPVPRALERPPPFPLRQPSGEPRECRLAHGAAAGLGLFGIGDGEEGAHEGEQAAGLLQLERELRSLEVVPVGHSVVELLHSWWA